MISKPILIDSIYVNCGGALSLLQYLVNTLQERKIDFYLLSDKRCDGLFDFCEVKYMSPKIMDRKNFYKHHRDEFHSVLCFGNVPPPISLRIPVYTYFHNINLLTLADCRDRKQRFLYWLKRSYITLNKRHTDAWFVQTSNTASELINRISVPSSNVQLYPFFKELCFPDRKAPRNDYVFVGEPSGSKGHKELIEAWRILHMRGFSGTLHLTVSKESYFINEIEQAIADGVRIINHGYISMTELASIYMECKATVYPSYNESLGLGMVEAMEAGCDVLASDRPFVYAICEPSIVFNNESPLSIANAILIYESGKCKKTTRKVRDMIHEMIDRLIAF